MEKRLGGTGMVSGAIAALVSLALTAGLVFAMALDLQRTFEAPPARRGVVLIESGAAFDPTLRSEAALPDLAPAAARDGSAT